MNKKQVAGIAVLVTALVAGAYTALTRPPAAPLDASSTTAPATLEVSVPNSDAASPTPEQQGCYYNWAYKDQPNLSAQVQAAIREIEAGAEAHTQAYGEDCIYADGHADFSAMETDFYVTLHVADLNDEADLGNWISKTMGILNRFPPDQTPGPQPGRVNLIFEANGQQRRLTFSIADYQKLPPNLNGADLLHALSHE